MGGQTKYVSYVPAGSPAWLPSRNPNWRGGHRDGWRHAKSVYAVDFQNNRGMNGPANEPVASCLSVTRTSAHYLLDNSDQYQFCDVNALALRSNAGAYIGGAFTNKIRNPRGDGGTSGLIGLGGVAPTNWLCEQAGTNFNYTLLVGQSENGLPATDIRIENLGNTSRRIIFEQSNTQIAALPGEAWGFDAFVKLQAGSLSSTTLALELQWRDSGGVVLGTSTTVAIAPTGGALSENYFSVKAVAPAQTTYVSLGLSVIPLLATPGATDVTLRIGPVKACKLLTLEGPEFVLNGDFSNGLIDWVATGTASLAVVGGELEIMTDGGNKGAQSPLIATQVGAVYRIAGRGRKGTANFQVNWTSPNQAIVGPSSSITNVDFTTYFLASTTSGRLFPFTTQAGICYFDNFSMKLLSAGYLPAYPIMPPAGTLGDSTRSADLVRASNFDWYDGADCDTGASVLVMLDLSHVGDGIERTLFELSDGTGANAVRAYISAGDRVGLKIIAGGVTQVDAALVTTVNTGNSAFGFGWGVGHCYVTNGIELVSADAATLPVITQQRMGCAVSAAPLNDMLRLVQTCVRLSPDEARDWVLSR